MILGISAAIAICFIVVRERKWQAWYVQQFNKLPGKLPQIFPKDKNDDMSVSAQRIGYISKVVIGFVVTAVVAWILVFITLVCAKR